MAKVLKRGRNIPLNFTSGTVLVLKPSPMGTTDSDTYQKLPFNFKLFNATDDILLCISFSTKRITFKDYALRSLGNGQGKEQSVDRSFNQSVTYGDTVSIHHYLTDSEFGRYQILLNGITVCHFDKRLPGPATQIGYENGSSLASNPRGPSYWNVSVYQIGDLLPEDRLALVRGR